MAKRDPEYRYDSFGKFRLMTEAEGYVLARRIGREPFVVTRKEWDGWSREPHSTIAAGENVIVLADRK